MIKEIQFLDPTRRLVEAVVDYLFDESREDALLERTPEGAYSLASCLIVVPTAQSGRNLRLSIARKAAELGYGGILSPVISMPANLLTMLEEKVATEAEELAVWTQVLRETPLENLPALFPKLPEPKNRTWKWALSLAKTFLDVIHILGEKALFIREVQSGVETERWANLATLEARVLKRLNDNGVLSRCQSRRKAAETGCTLSGIKRILLPSLVDLSGALETYLAHSPQLVTVLIHAAEADRGKFDAWGRPIETFAAAIEPNQIKAFPMASIEADAIASFFKSIPEKEAYPALVVCDSEMVPELEGAFQNQFSEDELVLKSPFDGIISASPFGRLLMAVLELSQSEKESERERKRDNYAVFSTILHSGDVARWASKVLGIWPLQVAQCIGVLDRVQNTFLPKNIDAVKAGLERLLVTEAVRPKLAQQLLRLIELLQEKIQTPYDFLQEVFSSLRLDEQRPMDRELIATVTAALDLRASCESELIPEPIRQSLFMQLISEATYTLESFAPHILSTAGWLELPWCLEDELVFAGFNEGCVPENIVGHSFLPDTLRAKLGLMTNARRAMRDSFLLAEAVASHGPRALAINLHQMDSQKNVMKPSRILFPGIAPQALPALAKRLYAVTKGNEGAPFKDFPAAWKLALPIPPHEREFRPTLSVTQLDNYRRNPFNFYLTEVFGDHSDDQNKELDALAFGSICHEVLDEFVKEGPKDSEDAQEIFSFLSARVDEKMAVYGAPLPVIITLQASSLKTRLRAFAQCQVEWHKQGWRILAAEQAFSCSLRDCPTQLKGKIDRIDQKEGTNELAIIDYKTASKLDGYEESLQLPVYRAMLEASGLYPQSQASQALAVYCLLGDNVEECGFYPDVAPSASRQAECESACVAWLTRLAEGIFCTEKDGALKFDSSQYFPYAELFGDSIENELSDEWLADQRARLAAASLPEPAQQKAKKGSTTVKKTAKRGRTK